MQASPLFCAGCKVTTYCSRDCQKKAWPAHKPTCKQGWQGIKADVLQVVEAEFNAHTKQAACDGGQDSGGKHGGVFQRHGCGEQNPVPETPSQHRRSKPTGKKFRRHMQHDAHDAAYEERDLRTHLHGG